MGPSSVDGRPPALNAYLYCPFHIWILSSIIQVPTSKLMLRVANLSFGNCQESWPLNFWTLWTLLYRSMLFVFNSFAFPSELLIQFHSSSRIPALIGDIKRTCPSSLISGRYFFYISSLRWNCYQLLAGVQLSIPWASVAYFGSYLQTIFT